MCQKSPISEPICGMNAVPHSSLCARGRSDNRRFTIDEEIKDACENQTGEDPLEEMGF